MAFKIAWQWRVAVARRNKEECHNLDDGQRHNQAFSFGSVAAAVEAVAAEAAAFTAAFVMESIHETNGTRDVNLATTPVLCLLRHAKMGNRTN